MPRSRNLVIVGVGGHAREIAATVLACAASHTEPSHTLVGFLEDAHPVCDADLRAAYGVGVIGTTAWLATHVAAADVVLGLGASRVRTAVAERVHDFGVRFATVVHPRAIISPTSRLGTGLYVGANAVITESVTLGDHVHVNVGATVSHDCRIGDFVTLAPGSHLAGAVTVGTGTEIGLGACVIQGITIGEWSTLGAGAVAVRDVPARATAVGVPARVRESA